MPLFSSPDGRRVEDLERRFGSFRSQSGAAENVGSRQSPPIGYRAPWVAFDCSAVAQLDGSYNVFPTVAGTPRGSEVDCAIARDTVSSLERFLVLGRGTWLALLAFEIGIENLGNYWAAMYGTQVTPLSLDPNFRVEFSINHYGQNYIFQPINTGTLASVSHTILAAHVIGFRGSPRPGSPAAFYFRVIIERQSVNSISGSSSVARRPPTLARALFIRLDADNRDGVEFSAGGGPLEPDPPPP